MQDSRPIEILEIMAGRRVMVVGDVMMDEYLWGNVRRISPEAPVMVVEVQNDTCTPGGAANVAKNVQALGGNSSIVGVVGDDETGRNLAAHLRDMGSDVGGLVTDPSRSTTRKTRIIAHSQQVVRVDRENRSRLCRRAVGEVIARMSELAPSSDVIVFSDYDKGMAGTAITQAVLDLARKHDKPFMVNSKPGNVRLFRAAFLITMNQSEAEVSGGIQITDDKSLARAAKKLLTMTQSEWLLITRGPNGMSLFGSDGCAENIPAHLVEVYDVAGAGDTVVSVLSLALAAGASVRDATILANCAGGAVVRKVGVATVTREEIAAMMRDGSLGA